MNGMDEHSVEVSIKPLSHFGIESRQFDRCSGIAISRRHTHTLNLLPGTLTR